MKRYLWTLVCLSISSSYAFDLEKKLETKIAKTISYVDTHQNAVWPGFKLSDMPTISLVDDDIANPNYAHLYAYNFSPKNTDWQRIIVNNKPAYYLDHDAYQLSGSQNGMALAWGYIEIDDQLTFVYVSPLNWISNWSINHYVEGFAHARFDYTYSANSFSFFEHDTDSFNDSQSVKLTYLEYSILSNYLKNAPANKDELLRDALAIGQYRINMLSGESREFHYGLKKYEQVPAYVGIKSISIADKDVVSLTYQFCDINSVTDYNIYQCEDFQREVLPGIVYGKALDRVRGSSWKSELMTRGMSVDALLREAYSMSDAEVTNRAEKIIASGEYGYVEISQAVDKVMRPYLDDLAVQENNYKLQPGIEMQVYIPEEDPVSMRFKSDKTMNDENKMYPLSLYRYLITNGYGELGTVINRDNHLVVDMYHTPYVYYNANFSASRTPWLLKYKISSDAKLVIDGNPTSASDFINAHKQVAFDSLKIETENLNIYVKGMKGILDASNGVLKLKTTMIDSILSKDLEKNRAAFRKKMHDKFMFGYTKNYLLSN